MEVLEPYIPLLIPLILIQLVLMIFALRDLSQREKTHGPKWMWVLIIVFGEMIGPVVYFLVGRVDE